FLEDVVMRGRGLHARRQFLDGDADMVVFARPCERQMAVAEAEFRHVLPLGPGDAVGTDDRGRFRRSGHSDSPLRSRARDGILDRASDDTQLTGAVMRAVKSLEITVLVDNTTDSLSPNPGFVETEFAFWRRHGMKWLSGQCLCCAAHGLSCLIAAKVGGETRTLLFDTGPDAWVFERNVTRLGVDLGAVEGMVLSHGHWDHGGGMPRALEIIPLGR